MAKPIYQDDEPAPKVRKPRRKKYPRGKYPRVLTSQSRDVKLLRLPWKQFVTTGEAAELMGVTRRTLTCNYFSAGNKDNYAMPDYIEMVYDGSRIVGLKRIGP